MSVKGEDLMRKDNKYYNLFNTDKSTYLKINNSNHCTDLTDDDFYKVIATIKNSNISVIVKDKN